MSAEEMAFHLPSLKKNDEYQRYSIPNINNQMYIVESSSLYPQQGFPLYPNLNNGGMGQGIYSQPLPTIAQGNSLSSKTTTIP